MTVIRNGKVKLELLDKTLKIVLISNGVGGMIFNLNTWTFKALLGLYNKESVLFVYMKTQSDSC